MTDEEFAQWVAGLKERAATYGTPGPRPVYDPGAAPMPKPPADAPKPPFPFTERNVGEDDA